jgi:hypothetical protein
LNARSNDGGAGLGARDSRGGVSETYIPQSRDDNPKRIANRKAVDDFMTKVASTRSRSSDVQQEARASSDSVIGVVQRDEPEMIVPVNRETAVSSADFIPATLGSRNLGSAQDIQARSLFDLFKLGESLIGDILRRDVTPENLLARGGVENLVNSIMSRNPNHEQQMQARDRVDDIIRVLSSRHEPSQQEARAPNDKSAKTNAFLDAILQSRGMPGLTTGDVLRILAGRTLNDLD